MDDVGVMVTRYRWLMKGPGEDSECEKADTKQCDLPVN